MSALGRLRPVRVESGHYQSELRALLDAALPEAYGWPLGGRGLMKRHSMLRLALAATVASGLTTGVLAQSPRTAAGVPIISEELMNRLITRTLAAKLDASISPRVCGIFGLCQPGQSMPAKQLSAKAPEGQYLFAIPLPYNSKDVLVGFLSRTELDVYLTDRTGALRAACVDDASGTHLITNGQAAKKYEAGLSLLAELAVDLPPTTSEPVRP